jgi:two-component sensor histidine kinase
MNPLLWKIGSSLRWHGVSPFYHWVRGVIFWCPAISLILGVVYWPPGRPFAMNFLPILILALTFSSTAFVIRSMLCLLFHRRGEEPWRSESKGARWYALTGLAAIVPGILLGSQFFQPVCQMAGFACTPLNLAGFKNSLAWAVIILGCFWLTELRDQALDEKREKELRLKALEVESLRAQLAAMTSRMSPHFLFNALNSIASLAHKSPDAAERTILKLSELYRSVLRASQAEIHPLQDELSIVENYLSLESVRFGKRLRASIEVDPDIKASSVMIPVLSIQPLVENAVLHGISGRASGGKVSVSVQRADDRVKISVYDDGVGFGNAIATSGTGNGISNCRTRLKLLFGSAGSLEIGPFQDGGTLAKVTLPIGSIRGEMA